jgi:hypothetical protein
MDLISLEMCLNDFLWVVQYILVLVIFSIEAMYCTDLRGSYVSSQNGVY